MENKYKKVWHSGNEKPRIYKDKITGHKFTTYCLCVYWYDGWNEAMCKVTEDGNFVDVETNKQYKHEFADYWCYTYDIYPIEINEKCLIDISVQEGH